MDQPTPSADTKPKHSLLSRWHTTPLYLRIIGALILGLLTGILLLHFRDQPAIDAGHYNAAEKIRLTLEIPARLIIKLLGAIAPPLILFAVIHALLHADVKPGVAGRLFYLLILNTTVAIIIGLVVANTIKPGKHAKLQHPTTAPSLHGDVLKQILDQIPGSLLAPLVENNVIGVIIVAIAFGIALRRLRAQRDISPAARAVELFFDAIVVVLHWVIDLIPFAVFGVIASIVGREGFKPFVALAWFVAAVLIGLFLQACYYLTRIKLRSWVSPLKLLKGTSDALFMAFSTDSSTATMPVTYDCLRKNVGLREESASLGALVGSNFNNDGTALYEAMSALFISQLIGADLTLGQQLIVVVMSIIASVGAAGIPEAGLVTMTLVFHAVQLPTEYIAILITVDWFLDRSRTMINVMGDMNVSCLLDGPTPPPTAKAAG